MAVKIAGRYLGRVTAWTWRARAVGAALALSLAGPPVPGAAWADGIMLIEAGAFWMGGDSDAPDEGPMHRVYVRDFWLDRNKVTNRELAQFLEARGLRSPEGVAYFDRDDPDARIHRRDGRFAADPGFEDHPGSAPATTASGAASACPPRPSGRRPPAGAIAAATRGATSRRTPSARSSGAPTTRPSGATSARPAPGPPGCRTCSATCGSGRPRPTGPAPTGRTTGAQGRSRNPGREPRRPPGRTARDDPAPLLV